MLIGYVNDEFLTTLFVCSYMIMFVLCLFFLRILKKPVLCGKIQACYQKDDKEKSKCQLLEDHLYGYLYNLQGDVVALVDGTGTKVVEYSYDAWGKPTSKTGSLAATLGTVQPFRYRGYVFDEETGLYYLRSRYYRAVWGRFLNADTLIEGNLFLYCANKPIAFVDSSGQYKEPNICDDGIICDCLTSPNEPPIEGTHYHTRTVNTDDYLVGVVVGSPTERRKRWTFRKYPSTKNGVGSYLLDPGTVLYVRPSDTLEWLEALVIHDNGYIDKGYHDALRVIHIWFGRPII